MKVSFNSFVIGVVIEPWWPCNACNRRFACSKLRRVWAIAVFVVVVVIGDGGGVVVVVPSTWFITWRK